MMPSSNGYIFRVTDLCKGNPPSQMPVTWGFDVFFDLRLNKWLNKQWRRRWFDTPSHSLWRPCNVISKHELGQQHATLTWLVCTVKHHCLFSLAETILTWLFDHTLAHWSKMTAISPTTFSSAFSCMIIYEFGSKLHRNLFLRVQLTIFKHCFR